MPTRPPRDVDATVIPEIFDFDPASSYVSRTPLIAFCHDAWEIARRYGLAARITVSRAVWQPSDVVPGFECECRHRLTGRLARMYRYEVCVPQCSGWRIAQVSFGLVVVLDRPKHPAASTSRHVAAAGPAPSRRDAPVLARATVSEHESARIARIVRSL